MQRQLGSTSPWPSVSLRTWMRQMTHTTRSWRAWSFKFAPRVSEVLDEFKRVAKPSARFWISTPGALAPMYKDSWQRFVTPQSYAVNNILPWELIRVLNDRGWSVHEQWGSFDNIAGQVDNVITGTQLDVSALPLPLQQAGATVWNVIASIGD